MSKIIDRYIFKEIAVPFIIILFVLTFVLLMGKILQIMDLIVNKGVSVISVIKVILFLMPAFMIFTIPIALLISILIGVGRLSSDNEITALKTSGISLLRMYYPVAIASLITFVFSIIISYFIVPQSNVATKRLLFNIVQQNANIGIKEKVFNDNFKGFLIYADKIPDNKKYMEGIVISDKRIIGEQNTILARKAFLVSDLQSMTVKLTLEDGSIHTVSSDLKNYRKIDFQIYDINLDLSGALSDYDESAKSTQDMTMRELLDKMKKPNLKENRMRELAIEAHKRFSTPLACIFFGIIGLPLGMRSHRSVKSKGFAIGLVVVSIYYVLRTGGEAFAETGYMPVAIGVWGPNLLYAVFGVLLFYVTNKEISLLQKINVYFWNGKRKN
ncbi:MAG: LPS export ABC transporter permease LptF [Smithella sp.]|nr:LPS export ABC transporter permease LptF [Smithella sp.]